MRLVLLGLESGLGLSGRFFLVLLTHIGPKARMKD